MLKVFITIIDHFNGQVFFAGNHSGRHFAQASSPPLHESVMVSVYPKITLDQLEH